MEAATLQDPREDIRPWRLNWLTPRRCRLLLAAVLCAGFLLHLRYLTHECPIDLSPDEAQYWDWSRQLDWSYYSKGPLVAWIIRASCAAFGDNMPAVRLPALLLSLGTSILTYALTLKLFASHRLALGAVLLNHFVPMFIAGSVLMTIDPPFFFCWAAAVFFAALAMIDQRPRAWLAAGLAAGLGILAKYGMLLWLPQVLLLLLAEKDLRRHLRSGWLWAGLCIALVFTTPMIIWNARHQWPTFQHVAHQTGASGGELNLGNIAGFFGGQAGALGPFFLIILIASLAWAIGRRTSGHPHDGAIRFLLWMGLPFWCWTALASLQAKVQVNWPAPAYFTLLILAAYFISTRLSSIDCWRPWRGWLWGAIVFGLICIPIAHNTEILYQPLRRIGQRLIHKPSAQWTEARWDPSHRLRGWKDLGTFVSDQQRTLRPNAFILCERYDFAAEMAFYVETQPKTYAMGTWFTDPQRRSRPSQYDFWPDRSLDNAQLLGRDAIFIGYGQDGRPQEPPRELIAAFAQVDSVQRLEVIRAGMVIRAFNTWRCHDFKGLKRPEGI